MPSRHGKIRKSIAELVNSLPRGTHLTAGEVYRRAKDQGLAVSLSTVYRALNRLREEGEVTALTSGRGHKWEAADEETAHDHLICTHCGLTIEFTDNLVSGFGRSVAARKGYDYHSSRFDIFGICENCQSQDEHFRHQKLTGRLEAALKASREAVRLIGESVRQEHSKKAGPLAERIRQATAELQRSIDRLGEAEILIEGAEMSKEPGYSPRNFRH